MSQSNNDIQKPTVAEPEFDASRRQNIKKMILCLAMIPFVKVFLSEYLSSDKSADKNVFRKKIYSKDGTLMVSIED